MHRQVIDAIMRLTPVAVELIGNRVLIAKAAFGPLCHQEENVQRRCAWHAFLLFGAGTVRVGNRFAATLSMCATAFEHLPLSFGPWSERRHA
jgi:hypothetical protein